MVNIQQNLIVRNGLDSSTFLLSPCGKGWVRVAEAKLGTPPPSASLRTSPTRGKVKHTASQPSWNLQILVKGCVKC